ncbi:intraflagellar transport protein 52 homolog [Salvelinus alpinus]|uniref:intraflagellar transport protein 52 homolog n=1 Tax=Salvelinus alpinus TaxID=8036 RepID=UPI0039FCC768
MQRTPRSQITPCYQTQAACLCDYEYACKMERKTQETLTSLFDMSTQAVKHFAPSHQFLQADVKHEPLQLITPQFETPLPQLEPAVFPPVFRDLPPPMLDLDETFSSESAFGTALQQM